MNEPDSGPVSVVHVGAALVALGLSAFVLILPKGDRRHRLAGYAYTAAMVLVNATAFGIYRLTGSFGPFHVMALVSLATLLSGLLPAWRRKPGWIIPHMRQMYWSCFGLYAALFAETGTRLVDMARFWSVVVASIVGVILIGMVVTRRMEKQLRENFLEP